MGRFNVSRQALFPHYMKRLPRRFQRWGEAPSKAVIVESGERMLLCHSVPSTKLNQDSIIVAALCMLVITGIIIFTTAVGGIASKAV